MAQAVLSFAANGAFSPALAALTAGSAGALVVKGPAPHTLLNQFGGQLTTGVGLLQALASELSHTALVQEVLKWDSTRMDAQFLLRLGVSLITWIAMDPVVQTKMQKVHRRHCFLLLE